MRLYKKIKPLGTGVTTSQANKGMLVINPTTVNNAEFTVNIINVDKTVTALELTVNAVNVNAVQLATNPNFSLIPFTISSWTDTSATGLIGYELF
jgi:hypothetical protein